MTVAPGPWPPSANRTTFSARVAGALALTKRRLGSNVRLAHTSRAASCPTFVKETVAATGSGGAAWAGANLTATDGMQRADATAYHDAVWGGNNGPIVFVEVTETQFGR